MIVSEVMTTALVTVAPCDSLDHAARVLVGRGLSSAPVVDEEGRLVGIVSEVDLLQAWLQLDPAHAVQHDPAPGTPSLADLRVRDVMTTRLLTLEPTADVWDAAHLLVQHGVKAAPVAVGTRPVGLVARQDLLTALGAGAGAWAGGAVVRVTPGPAALVGTGGDGRG